MRQIWLLLVLRGNKKSCIFSSTIALRNNQLRMKSTSCKIYFDEIGENMNYFLISTRFQILKFYRFNMAVFRIISMTHSQKLWTPHWLRMCVSIIRHHFSHLTEILAFPRSKEIEVVNRGRICLNAAGLKKCWLKGCLKS